MAGLVIQMIQLEVAPGFLRSAMSFNLRLTVDVLLLLCGDFETRRT